jgi:hypothetical protein
MSITLLTVSLLKMRAEAIISSFASWSVSKGTTIVPGEATNLRLRGYGTNVASFTVDCAAVMAAAGYGALAANIKTDIESIAATMATVASNVASLIDPDDHFTALNPTRQSAIVAEVIAAGIAADWAGVPADLKADLLQHDVVDSGTVSSIVSAVTIA